MIRSHGLLIRSIGLVFHSSSHGLSIRSLKLDNSFSRTVIRFLDLHTFRSLDLNIVLMFSRIVHVYRYLQFGQSVLSHCNSIPRIKQSVLSHCNLLNNGIAIREKRNVKFEETNYFPSCLNRGNELPIRGNESQVQY